MRINLAAILADYGMMAIVFVAIFLVALYLSARKEHSQKADYLAKQEKDLERVADLLERMEKKLRKMRKRRNNQRHLATRNSGLPPQPNLLPKGEGTANCGLVYRLVMLWLPQHSVSSNAILIPCGSLQLKT